MIHQCHRRTEGELKSDDTGDKPVRQANAAEKRTASELENVWILFFSKIKSWTMQRAPLRVTGATSGVWQRVDPQWFAPLLTYAEA